MSSSCLQGLHAQDLDFIVQLLPSISALHVLSWSFLVLAHM